MKKYYFLFLIILFPFSASALCYQGSGATNTAYNVEFHDNGNTIAGQPVYQDVGGTHFLSYDADTYWRADDSAPYSGAYNSYKQATIAGAWTNNVSPPETAPTFTLVTCSGGGGGGGSGSATTTVATTTPQQDAGGIAFGLAIIIVFISMGFSGYIWNHLFKPKWK